MIKLVNISKYYNNNGNISVGIRDCNLEFHKNEFVAITGESGSGKSTLLNILSGNSNYEEGQMIVDSIDTSGYGFKEMEDYKRSYISFVFQDYKLIDAYTVIDNVELALMLNMVDKKLIKEKSLELIERVGLKDHINQKCSELSGGQKQRVAIARALAKDSPIILCDEPTGNLDEKMAREIMKLLHEISATKLVIVVTHDYEDLSDYATRKIRIFDGKIVEDKVFIKMEDKSNFVTNFKPKNYYKNILKTALKNLFSMPKKTFFMGLTIFMGANLSLIISQSLVLVNDNNSYSTLDDSTDRLVVYSKDNSDFSLDELKSREGIKRIDYNDAPRDDYYYTAANNNGHENSTLSILIRSIDDAPKKYKKDLLDNEYILYADDYDKKNFSSEYKTVFFAKNQRESFSHRMYPTIEENLNYRVKDIIQRNGPAVAYFNNKTYQKLLNNYAFTKNALQYNEKSCQVLVTDSLPKNIIYLPKGESDLSYEVLTIAGKSIDLSNMEIVFFESFANNAYVSSALMESLDLAINNNYASVKFDTTKMSAKELDKLIASEELYTCYFPNLKEATEDTFYLFFQSVAKIVKIICTILVFCMVYVIVSRIFKSKTNDYIIMRSLGYNNRLICWMMIFENLLVGGIAILLSNVLGLTLKICKVKFFATLGAFDLLVIPIIILILLVVFAYAGNKKIFSTYLFNSFENSKDVI